jgi:hypothetical protein
MLWTAQFIVCSLLFGGCIEVNLKDNKLFKDKDECEVFADKMSDVLIMQMEQQSIIGELRYGCVEHKQKENRI